MKVVPAHDAPLGAEITGMDLASQSGPDAAQFVKDALHKYKVVVLRNQRITSAQQIEFCRYFGSLDRHVLPQYLVPGYPELVRVSNILDESGDPIGIVDAGRFWHSDAATQPKPNMYSALYALEIPFDDTGKPLGDTLFVATDDAYDALPAAMKRRIDGLKAVNSLAAIYEELQRMNLAAKRDPLTDAQKREVVHPVVRTHPVTGRKCIYVSKSATVRIVGLPEGESRSLIHELSDWCTRSEDIIYRHRWQTGDLLFWDNCSGQHLAIGDYQLPRRRLMHRTTVGGSVPF
ncbi:MAG: TauD/TfdA dioxygenase family protein [Lautropia sp.]